MNTKTYVESEGNFKQIATFLSTFVVALVLSAVAISIVTVDRAVVSAAVGKPNAKTCLNALGRVWDAKTRTCTKQCWYGDAAHNAGTLVTASPYDYCNGAASKLPPRTCAKNGRRHLLGVCIKMIMFGKGAAMTDKKGRPMPSIFACRNKYHNYYVAEPYDYCALKPRA